ncbi:MAG: sterol desaturase family protein [Candidatus Hydrogenedentes bacterium]|nr:sterol desaturase family protein [Candidatus Hydrogenedentota bacterium]
MLVSGALALTAYAFTFGYDKVITLAVIYVGFALLVGVIEQVMPHNPAWNLRDGQVMQDLGHTFVGSVLAPRLADGMVLALMAAPQVWLAEYYGGTLWPGGWPIAAQAALAIVLGDFGGYWSHRLAHEIPFLWRFHALHHSPLRLYFVNTGRFHPIDSMKSTLMIAPLLILLGAPEEVMLWQIAFTNYVGILSHCNIEMRCGCLNFLFNTPGVHRWHHSRLPREADNNYGENVMIYDLLFRTHLNPDRPPPVDLGIKAAIPSGFTAQLLSPLHFDALEAEGARLRALASLETDTAND